VGQWGAGEGSYVICGGYFLTRSGEFFTFGCTVLAAKSVVSLFTASSVTPD